MHTYVNSSPQNNAEEAMREAVTDLTMWAQSYIYFASNEKGFPEESWKYTPEANDAYKALTDAIGTVDSLRSQNPDSKYIQTLGIVADGIITELNQMFVE